MSERVKLADIALRLGVGKSTVHRALTRHPRCRPETAERIRRVAEEMGYRPDPLFSAMGCRRRGLSADGLPIAYLVHQPPEGPKLGQNLAAPLSELALRLGYSLQFINTAEFEGHPARLWSILRARGCAGVMVNSPRFSLLPLLHLNDTLPVVCVGRGDALPYPTVRPDTFAAVRIAFQRMHALGYRRVGAVLHRHEPMAEDDHDRLAGALAGPRVLGGGSVEIPPFFEPRRDRDGLLVWWRAHRPDAVLAFGADTFYFFQSLGARIPEEVGFASLHLDALAPEDPLQGRLAGTSQNRAEVARASLRLLDQLIRQGEHARPGLPIHLVVPPTWRDGETLPPRRV